MIALSPPRQRSAAPPPRVGGGHRPEIDGLRAVAVLLVAGYHIWFGRVSGGVDVFLLLTGFLITGSLVRACERGGGPGIRYGAFLSRLAVRLVPTAVLVIAVTLVGARLLLPETAWQDASGQAVASALYHLNWQLALDSADYLARDESTSAFQHFWSLSIQGQFYLLWPLVIGAAVWWATRSRSGARGGPAATDREPGIRRTVALALAGVFALSLAYSVYITRADQPWAYFDTGARLWEFALGGLLALALPWLNPPRALRLLLGWGGLVALVLCGVLLQVSTAFPGYAALWPTLAAVAVVVAGTTGSPWGADRILTLRAMRYLGSVSYALYLWHWPVLAFYLAATERTLASPLGGAAVLALSVALAAATTPLSDRIADFGKRGRTVRGPALALACVLPLLLTAGTWTARMDAEQRHLEEQVADTERYPGALALADGRSDHGEYPDPVHPDPANAADDLPVTYDDDCNQDTAGTDVIVCEYGADDPERTIALVGGSHAAHWFPALEEIAEDRGWRVLNIVKGACLFTDAPQTYKGDPYTACAEWNDGVMAELAELRPDAVFTTGTTTSHDTSAGYGEEQVVDGYPERWRELGELGIEVVAVRDTPRPGFDVPECLAGSESGTGTGPGTGPDECTSEPADSMADTSPLEGVDLPEHVSTLDLTDQFCEPGVCRPIVGNVLVHWDDGHVTAAYMRTLVPVLEERLLAATGW
ncbi:acyltransferase family protein [Nocardiopsis salina]|uniref:acyltransferase family protein n=1 Tax=Nocardiopsis salina TaxID=245836 RepID=UPI000345208F|nr:acyltransferase family protein [Nocardiopsis salina]